jgi:hypothetical protein
LLGALAANRASARRDTVSRLWEQRTRAYIELMNWVTMVGRELFDPASETPREVSPDTFARLRMSDELLVHLSAFASDSVRYGYEQCNAALSCLAFEPKSTFDYPAPTYADLIKMLEQGLGDIATSVRRELSTGSLHEPGHVRRRQRRYSASID